VQDWLQTLLLHAACTATGRWSKHQDAAMKRKEERKASAAAWVPGTGIRGRDCAVI
jgi:hypothetical protein